MYPASWHWYINQRLQKPVTNVEWKNNDGANAHCVKKVFIECGLEYHVTQIAVCNSKALKNRFRCISKTIRLICYNGLRGDFRHWLHLFAVRLCRFSWLHVSYHSLINWWYPWGACFHCPSHKRLEDFELVAAIAWEVSLAVWVEFLGLGLARKHIHRSSCCALYRFQSPNFWCFFRRSPWRIHWSMLHVCFASSMNSQSDSLKLLCCS